MDGKWLRIKSFCPHGFDMNNSTFGMNMTEALLQQGSVFFNQEPILSLTAKERKKNGRQKEKNEATRSKHAGRSIGQWGQETIVEH